MSNFLCQVNFIFFSVNLLVFILIYYFTGDNQTEICGISKINCYQFIDRDVHNYVHNGMEDDCNCLPACTSITYEAEFSQANFDFNGLSNVFRILYQNILKVNLTAEHFHQKG